MALTAIQQEKWAQQMDAFLTTMLVGSNVCDRAINIDGSDIFHIITPTDISTFTTDDTADITYSLPTDADVQVTKNFDKGFGLLILDTNKMQTQVAGWEQAFARNGAYQIGSDLDTAILANHAAFTTDFYETGTTAWQFTKDTCADIPGFFAKLMKEIRDQKVDNLGQPYIVGPPGLEEAINTYTGGRATNLGDTVILAGGQRMFPYMGFNVYISNNCNSAGGTTHGMAGIEGYGYALGVYTIPESIEVVGRAEGRFGDLIRGRVAAGYKVYRGAAMFDVHLNDTVVATS